MKGRPKTKCNASNPCGVHKDGKYKKWNCGQGYSKEDRRQIYLNKKKPCIKCNHLCSPNSDICSICFWTSFNSPLKGKKLPKWWVKKIRDGQKKGEESVKWKGDEADYFSKHKDIVKKHGNPKKCEGCGIKGKKNKGGRWTIQWANISGEYKRVLEDYRGLCTRCHKIFDGLKKDFPHGTVAKYREKCRCELCKKAKQQYRIGLLEYSRIIS